MLERAITLYFLITGRTKKVCDGAFDYIKHNFRCTGIPTPKIIMDVTQKSASTKYGILSNNFSWVLWKDNILPNFTIYAKPKITELHLFKFCNSKPSMVNVRALYST